MNKDRKPRKTEKLGEPTDPFQVAARIIAGDRQAPAWVAQCLRHQGNLVRAIRERELQDLTRKEVSDQLEKVEKLLQKLANLLDENGSVCAYIRDGKREPWAHPGPHLIDIAERARIQRDAMKAIKGPERAKPLIAGKPPKRHIGYASPDVHCAIIVAEVWFGLHGNIPGADNPTAHRACEALWIATGGAPNKSKFGDPARWVRPLNGARKFPPAEGEDPTCLKGSNHVRVVRRLLREDIASGRWGTE